MSPHKLRGGPCSVTLTGAFTPPWGGLRAHAGLGTYMVVTLLFMAAVNVAVPNVCLFAKEVFGMKDQQIANLMLVSLIVSALAAFGAGRDVYAGTGTGRRPLTVREDHGIYGLLRYSWQYFHRDRAGDCSVTPGDLWRTRDGSLPRRLELLCRGYGARNRPPPAHPRRPHPRR
jgi:hypothetical protein